MINNINEYWFEDDINEYWFDDDINYLEAKSDNSKYWSDWVTQNSGAMCLPEGIFTWQPLQIAEGLKKAVMESNKTKGTKFQSAMSMLNFYINRAGKKLPHKDKERLEAAKVELRKVFEKDKKNKNKIKEPKIEK